MNLYRKLFFLLLFLSFSSFAKNEKIYTVATVSSDYLSYEIFDLIERKLNIKFRYENFSTFDEAFDSFKTGNIDFWHGVTYTDERSEIFSFSKPIVADYGFLFLPEERSSDAEISSIAVPKGTVLASTSAVPSKLSKVIVHEYASLDEAKNLLEYNIADGVIAFLYDLQKMLALDLKPHDISSYIVLKPSSIVTPKGRHLDILKKIEEYAIGAEFQTEIKIRVMEYQKNLRAASLRANLIKSDVDISKPLNIVLDKNYSSRFVKYDEGVVTGIVGEIVSDACNMLQLNCNITISNVKMGDEGIFANLGRKTIDIVGPVAINDKIQEKFHTSNGFYTQHLILVKRAGYKNNTYTSLGELFLETLGVVSNTYGESRLLEFFSSDKVVKYKNSNQLLNALVNKDINYAFVTRADFYEKLTRNSESLPIVQELSIEEIYNYDLGLAFPKTKQGYALAQFFSYAIELNEDFKIVEKYDIPPTWHEDLLWQKKLRWVSLAGFFIVGIVLFLSIYFFYIKSTTDELTKLKNRLAIYKKFGKRLPKGHSVVYLDINKFKYINDTFGHAIGDKALQLLADRIKRHWKGQGYRIGGDEFVLVCKGSPKDVEQMLAQMNPYKLVDVRAGVDHEVTLSIGVVDSIERDTPLDGVLNLADKKMYQSKSRFRQSNRS